MRKKLLSAGDFAEKARITLATLHHYDKIGLLSPFSRGENNYRYYSLRQLSEVNLIRTMQKSGLSLSDIKSMKDRRTPDRTVEVLRLQAEKIEETIDEWRGARRLIMALLHSILSVRETDESAIAIRFMPAEPIVLGDWNEYGEGEEGYDALVRFYDSIDRQYPGLDWGYPVWGLFSKENVKEKMSGKQTWPERYYFYSQEGRDKRPAGFYATGYTRGGYGQGDELYARLRDYIERHGFEVCGDAYEEYPLNEICIADSSNYLIRIMVAVREKKGSAD